MVGGIVRVNRKIIQSGGVVRVNHESSSRGIVLQGLRLITRVHPEGWGVRIKVNHASSSRLVCL